MTSLARALSLANHKVGLQGSTRAERARAEGVPGRVAVVAASWPRSARVLRDAAAPGLYPSRPPPAPARLASPPFRERAASRGHAASLTEPAGAAARVVWSASGAVTTAPVVALPVRVENTLALGLVTRGCPLLR